MWKRIHLCSHTQKHLHILTIPKYPIRGKMGKIGDIGRKDFL